MAAPAERAWPGGLPVSGRDMAVRREAGLVAKADARRNASASHAARTQGGGLNATLVLIGIGIVVPNLLAVAALACDIGLPPRPMPILGYCLIAGLARWRSPRFMACLYFMVLAYDLMSTISGMFGLSAVEIEDSLRFASDLRLLSSPLYLGMAGSAAAMMALMPWLFRRSHATLRRARIGPAMILVMGLVLADTFVAITPNYALGSILSQGTRVVSAVEVSGFGATVLRAGNGRDVLLVLVEALGRFVDPAHQRLLEMPFQAASLRKHYQVTTGTVPYFGATTAGEMRELCHSREPYTAHIGAASQDCLPAVLAAAGYRTTAVHAYSENFFDRQEWYPNIGFERMLFGEQMLEELHDTCGGVFRGLCDDNVGETVLPRLMAQDKQKQFVYWLTLNTHVPVRPGEGTPRLGCADAATDPFGHGDVCAMTELWLDVFDRVVALALADPKRPMDILLMGDHAPPLWSRKGRALFRPGEVTWIRLAPRG